MVLLLKLVFWVLCLVSAGYVLRQYLRGKRELMSTCSMFLAGLIFFQLINAPPVLSGASDTGYEIANPVPAVQIYAMWSTIFVAVFLFAYEAGGPGVKLAQRVRIPERETADWALWLLIPACVALAFFFKLSLRIPWVGVLATMAGQSLAGAAAGLAAWLLVRQLWNPLAWVLAIPTFVASAWVSVYQEFSRRPLVSVMIAIIWGAYYSRYRYMRPTNLFPRVAVLGGIGLIAVSLFTSGGRGFSDISKLASPTAIKESVEQTTETYITARCAIWLVDANFVQGRDLYVWPAQTLHYILTFPIPRLFWNDVLGIDKPYTIANYMATWSQRDGVRRGVTGGVTNPVGIIGNPAGEAIFHNLFGATITVALYAVVFAWIIRFFDAVLDRGAHQSLIAIPIGSTMGQAFGIPRGETATFTFTFIFGTIVVAFVFSQALKIIQRLAGGSTSVPVGPATYEEYQESYAGYGDETERHVRVGAFDGDLTSSRSMMLPGHEGEAQA